MSGASPNRIPALDGIRGIAILLVLFNHSRFLFPNFLSEPMAISLGQEGVGIFFTLSGFLITTLLMREMQNEGRINFGAFYLRRAFRLMPAAWTYLIAVAIVFAGQSQEIPACLLFFRNFVDPLGQHLPTAHFWSLSIEEQFYLVWPLTLFLARRRVALWISLSAASLVALLRLAHQDAINAASLQSVMGTHLHADGLLIGCAAALLMPEARRFLRGYMAYPLLACVVFSSLTPHRIPPLYESVLFALLIMVTSELKTAASSVLAFKPLAFIGQISYSIYLWNQLFLARDHRTVVSILFCFPGLLACALLSYYVIERPGQRLGVRLQRKPIGIEQIASVA